MGDQQWTYMGDGKAAALHNQQFRFRASTMSCRVASMQRPHCKLRQVQCYYPLQARTNITTFMNIRYAF